MKLSEISLRHELTWPADKDQTDYAGVPVSQIKGTNLRTLPYLALS